MINLVCLLEEPSAEEMLKGIFPRLLPDDTFVKFIVFDGKQDLEKQIVRRLRFWQKPDSVFLIMRDKDAGDCKQVKQDLVKKTREAGRQAESVVKIACHELESFYLGDLVAVEKGLSISNLQQHQDNRTCRSPDSMPNATDLLKKITKSRYQKVAGSRAIGPYLNLDGSNRSRSFNVLISGVNRLLHDN
jgi:uncharacterized protein DUF4276